MKMQELEGSGAGGVAGSPSRAAAGRDVGGKDVADQLSGSTDGQQMRASQQSRTHGPAGVRRLVHGRYFGQTALPRRSSGQRHAPRPLVDPRRIEFGAQ